MFILRGAEQLDALHPVNQDAAQRIACLKTDKHDGIALIPDALLEVVTNPPAGTHAAAGDDQRASSV